MGHLKHLSLFDITCLPPIKGPHKICKCCQGLWLAHLESEKRSWKNSGGTLRMARTRPLPWPASPSAEMSAQLRHHSMHLLWRQSKQGFACTLRGVVYQL